MTVEEMKEDIKNKCMNIDWKDCYLCPLYDNEGSCYENLKSEEIKRNYELMFGKEGSKMKNEFKIKDIKAGYLVRIKEDNSLLLAIQSKNEMDFYDETLCYVCSESDMGFDDSSEYCIIEVYGYYDDSELFDISDRPLLYKEDMNFKIYKIGDLEIKPNYEEKEDGYKTENEDFLFIENINENDEYVCINKSELNDVINALTEIRDFIKEDK